jgi:hypothetical protein
VDTKGKVLFARTFIHNKKFASAGKSHLKFSWKARRFQHSVISNLDTSRSLQTESTHTENEQPAL